MDLSLSLYNYQASKTSLEYEARITKLDEEADFRNALEQNSPDEKTQDSPVLKPNAIILDEEQLSLKESLKKDILQTVLGGFGLQGTDVKFIPDSAFNFSYENSSVNPYSKSLSTSAQSLTYSSQDEYYERTSLEFFGQVIVTTPNGKYSIDLNFSYTDEYYEKNVFEVELMKERLNTPFELNLDSDEYENALKELKTISVLLDIISEKEQGENKSLLDFLKEQLLKSQEEQKENEKKQKDLELQNSFKVYMKEQTQEFSLQAVQKNGMGLFFADIKSESLSFDYSSNSNGSSLFASYSRVESSVSIKNFEDLKV